jgi:hypothetical protein
MNLQPVSISAMTAAFLVFQGPSRTVAVDVHNTAVDKTHDHAPNEIWVSGTRADGKGKGSRVDPMDGSTSTKLDGILRSIANNTTVHFGPGVFQTSGFQDDSSSLGFSLKTGCKYVGAGMGVTTMKVVTARGGNGSSHDSQVFHSNDPTTDNVEIRDMTIDANGDALVAANSIDFKAYGANITGANCSIRNAHLIHVYGHFATNREAFGLGVTSRDGSGLIEHCFVDTFATGNDYGQMININGGAIRSCQVSGQTTLTSAYSAYGSNNTLVNNRAINCNQFLYMDTGNVDHLTVRDNRAIGLTGKFINLAQSVGYSHHDVVIERNAVDFAATGGLFFGASASDSTHLYNIRLSNNTTTQSSGKYYVRYDFSTVNNFSENNNHWLGETHVGSLVFDPASNNHNVHAQLKKIEN